MSSGIATPPPMPSQTPRRRAADRLRRRHRSTAATDAPPGQNDRSGQQIGRAGHRRARLSLCRLAGRPLAGGRRTSGLGTAAALVRTGRRERLSTSSSCCCLRCCIASIRSSRPPRSRRASIRSRTASSISCCSAAGARKWRRRSIARWSRAPRPTCRRSASKWRSIGPIWFAWSGCWQSPWRCCASICWRRRRARSVGRANPASVVGDRGADAGDDPRRAARRQDGLPRRFDRRSRPSSPACATSEPLLLVYSTADGQIVDQTIPMKPAEDDLRYRVPFSAGRSRLSAGLRILPGRRRLPQPPLSHPRAKPRRPSPSIASLTTIPPTPSGPIARSNRTAI